MICIEDIAHSLSNQCRFGGHLPVFYSVAQHSIFCSNFLNANLSLAGLLHDASEAYLLDIPSPVKKGLTNYKEIENNIMGLIAQKFEFEFPLHPYVKMIDEMALKVEWHELMLRDVEASQRTLFPLTREAAKHSFLKTFHTLNR